MSFNTFVMLLLGAAIIFGPILARNQIRQKSRPRKRRPRNRQAPPARPIQPPHVPQQQPVRPAKPAKPNQAQTRAILQRRLGVQWEAEQQRLRARVLEQERKIAARMRQAQQQRDFEELTGLHSQSRQAADLAYATMDSARNTEQAISDSIRDTHRHIDADRARGGRQVPTLRAVLDGLHLDRAAIQAHRERYLQDVQRLNRATGELRDAINANCGEKGRRWYQALMARTAARREGKR
ncbi:hypothetical protein Dvina_50455 [Dactylosporangium vinaceum]|uniref:Secreted protein n=1 Tax=Dactylosporangium vinaceum TaxID=53362 RepID=A0ABV5M4S7_9ACTN|nr:hypothetical protein [Dactylosporangium vinaceum]UAB96087.1 hypothetical protein Dvina_50455 [Dactylosporangium vinaceum]